MKRFNNNMQVNEQELVIYYSSILTRNGFRFSRRDR